MQYFIEKVKNIGLENFNFSDITSEDMQQFASILENIRQLIDSYNNSYNRKQIAAEIVEKIGPTKTFIWLLDNELKGIKNNFECSSNSVSDYEAALRLILRLANEQKKKYSLKAFTISDYVSQEIKFGDREVAESSGTAWVIAEDTVIGAIADKTYYGCELYNKLNNITSAGYPLVVVTNHYYYSNVIPHFYSSLLEKFTIKLAGVHGDLVCFLKDGALMDAVSKFRAWITQNGGDIKGLNEDRLFELMRKI